MIKATLNADERDQIRQLNFYYRDASNNLDILNDSQLFDLLINLDNNLKKHALAKAMCEGGFGFFLLISGYNILTHLHNSFLQGIVLFSLGAIFLAASYPLYNFLLKRSRKKYAPVVLTITKYLY
ncbi:hypothetical protein SAMN04487761_12817 [Lachnospiraceae bacterium C7]|nr:hypothetical protein SAMN04487761_12817 [Lachnospiraceae bacterium C7]